MATTPPPSQRPGSAPRGRPSTAAMVIALAALVALFVIIVVL